MHSRPRPRPVHHSSGRAWSSTVSVQSCRCTSRNNTPTDDAVSQGVRGLHVWPAATCVVRHAMPASSEYTLQRRQVVPHGHASQRIGGPVGSPPNTAAQAPGHDRMRGIVDKHGPTSSIQSSPSGPAVPLRLRHSQCKTLLQSPRHLIIYYL